MHASSSTDVVAFVIYVVFSILDDMTVLAATYNLCNTPLVTVVGVRVEVFGTILHRMFNVLFYEDVRGPEVCINLAD